MVDYSDNSFNSSKSPGSFTSPMGKSTPVSDQDRSGMSDGSWAAEKKLPRSLLKDFQMKLLKLPMCLQQCHLQSNLSKHTYQLNIVVESKMC